LFEAEAANVMSLRSYTGLHFDMLQLLKHLLGRQNNEVRNGKMLNVLRQGRILIFTEVGIITPYKLVGGCQKFWKNVLLPLLLLLLLLLVVVVVVVVVVVFLFFFWHRLNNTASTLHLVPTSERTKSISVVKRFIYCANHKKDKDALLKSEDFFIVTARGTYCYFRTLQI